MLSQLFVLDFKARDSSEDGLPFSMDDFEVQIGLVGKDVHLKVQSYFEFGNFGAHNAQGAQVQGRSVHDTRVMPGNYDLLLSIVLTFASYLIGCHELVRQLRNHFVKVSGKEFEKLRLPSRPSQIRI